MSIGVFVEKIGMGTTRGSLEVDFGGSMEGVGGLSSYLISSLNQNLLLSIVWPRVVH